MSAITSRRPRLATSPGGPSTISCLPQGYLLCPLPPPRPRRAPCRPRLGAGRRTTRVRSAASGTARPPTWRATARPTVPMATRRPGSVRTATRSTCPCPPSACMCAPTTRAAAVLTAASDSQGHGCCRGTSAHTPERNPSPARNAQRASLTSPTCGPMSRRTARRSPTCAGVAGKPSRSSPTSTSTKSRRACVESVSGH